MAKAIKGLALLLLIVYLGWEIYWSTQVGLSFVKWHTHLMVYAYLGLFGFLAFKLLGSSVKVKNVFLVYSSVLISLFIGEIFLSFYGVNKTYLEKISGHYESPYHPPEKDYYHTWPKGVGHWIRKPEYSYWRPTNSLGFADVEWSVAKKPGQLRILSLGDSFTEGDGAPFDSSYVAIMERELHSSDDSIYIMNAGTCGSDPFNNYMNLRDRLMAYEPDIVIQSIHSADMSADILLRGGFGRFQQDGTVKYEPGPWWEPIYAVSYVGRTFFKIEGYNELLRKNSITPNEINRVNESVKDLFAQYTSLCKAHHVKLLFVIHPEKQEVEHNKYDYDFSYILNHLPADESIKVADLLPSYREYIKVNSGKIADYYWRYDGHHNSKGYKMMAETTLKYISPLLMDSIQ